MGVMVVVVVVRRGRGVVRPPLGQQLLENRQYGHVQQLTLGQGVHAGHARAAKGGLRSGRADRRTSPRRAARLAPSSVVNVRRALHVRCRGTSQTGPAVPGRRRGTSTATGTSARSALFRHRTVHGTGRRDRRRTVVFCEWKQFEKKIKNRKHHNG